PRTPPLFEKSEVFFSFYHLSPRIGNRTLIKIFEKSELFHKKIPLPVKYAFCNVTEEEAFFKFSKEISAQELEKNRLTVYAISM
ncbi:MAG: hypothetical protein IKC65_06545, partial [Lentisphaeria bacterium]|nr:hypothetical protein [Lentisphaeria bacterium]